MPDFVAWPKIPRAGAQERVVITEKIDGTNGCIIIENGIVTGIQSRKRFITPDDDNYGFARWVNENLEAVLQLGDGYHYGEWAGPGIQRNPLKMDEKYFFLFNTFRWGEHNPAPSPFRVVPVIYDGDNYVDAIADAMKKLSDEDRNAEGVIAYYCKTRRYEKHTFELIRGKWQAA